MSLANETQDLASTMKIVADVTDSSRSVNQALPNTGFEGKTSNHEQMPETSPSSALSSAATIANSASTVISSGGTITQENLAPKAQSTLPNIKKECQHCCKARSRHINALIIENGILCAEREELKLKANSPLPSTSEPFFEQSREVNELCKVNLRQIDALIRKMEDNIREKAEQLAEARGNSYAPAFTGLDLGAPIDSYGGESGLAVREWQEIPELDFGERFDEDLFYS